CVDVDGIIIGGGSSGVMKEFTGASFCGSSSSRQKKALICRIIFNVSLSLYYQDHKE
ncbi:MAG: hypothetical protein GY874_05890, partial [Desulfobacteraceae bacterium]|nr:hypothetical protein [Desulfobacteraceae bacterium]